MKNCNVNLNVELKWINIRMIVIWPRKEIELKENFESWPEKVGMHRTEKSWPKLNQMKHLAEYRTWYFTFFPPSILSFFLQLHK